MVECARWAPSDTNAQPWHFTIVTQKSIISGLERATRDKFAALATELASAGRRDAARKMRVFEKYAARFGEAPVLVVVSGEPYDSRFMREVFADLLEPSAFAQLAHEESIKSTALAAMNLLLAAHVLGYGAVPMTGPVIAISDVLKAQLSLPARFEPHLVIALGRSAAPSGAVMPRKELAAVVTWMGGDETPE